MKPKPAASIVIPVLNGEATIGELLVALKAQAGVPGGFEILVVDNGSTDRTVEIVRAHGLQPLQEPKRGPAAARNRGLNQATADIVLCTDSDCVPTRRWAASLLTAFADPEVILATGPIHGWQPVTGAERYVSTRDITTREKTAEHRRHPFAWGMHMGIRRQVLLEVGGWDEAMTNGEDLDLCLRLRKKYPQPIRFVEQAVLFHKHRSTDEALWRQARGYGVGYALVHRRHPDLLPWPVWRSAQMYTAIALLKTGAPFVALCRALRVCSAERAEFERYHYTWMGQFWSGFFSEWSKRPT